MNWEALGAISETMGAIGVIVSLLYLAKQIRISSKQTEQNSNIVRGTAYQQFRQQVNSVVGLRISDPILSDIWDRGLRDFESLNRVEQSQLGGVFFMMVGNWESQFHLQKVGVFDESMGTNSKLVLNTAGFQHWWLLRQETYSAEFREHIENKMKGDA